MDVLATGSHYVSLVDLELNRDLPASVSSVLGLKTCTTKLVPPLPPSSLLSSCFRSCDWERTRDVSTSQPLVSPESGYKVPKEKDLELSRNEVLDALLIPGVCSVFLLQGCCAEILYSEASC